MQRLQRDEGNTYVVYSAEGFGRDSLISTIQEVGVFVDGNGIYANCTNSFEVGRIYRGVVLVDSSLTNFFKERLLTKLDSLCDKS